MAATSDIVIIGGGIIGLAIALELRMQGASVTIVNRDFSQAATHAAAGMLAPQAEALPPGPMLDLCLRSRSLYPVWTHKLEALTGLNTGYWPCGILSPLYEHTSPPTHTPHPTPPKWLDRPSIHHHQPGLSLDVIGGWWYPDDAQVDNRALAQALWVAVHELGVTVKEGVTVRSVLRQGSQVMGVQTAAETLQAGHYILATGSWSQEMLPIPVSPRKGQMLSVRVPAGETQPLQQVLFGSEIYIVPRQDGRIVIGATSEDVGFTPNNTPAGVQRLLTQAIRLYPVLQQFPIEELWWGFRPATPDELPILGASPYENLTLATGHYRNGILLAPITAALIAASIVSNTQDASLQPFHWSRFQQQRR